MTHPVSAFQKNHFLYPRTANDAYGIFAVKEVQRQNDLIRQYLKDVYDFQEKRPGVTTNAEYGSYMHVIADQENPMRQNWHIDYPNCPEDSPRPTPRNPVLPPLIENQHVKYEASDNISLPPLSYRKHETETETQSPPKSPRKAVDSDRQNGHIHLPKPLPPTKDLEKYGPPVPTRRIIPSPPLPPTKDFNEKYGPKPVPIRRIIPSPPLPPTERLYEQSNGDNQETPRTYCRKNPPHPLPPFPDSDMSPRSPRQCMRYQSSENTPRLFPPVYSNRQPALESQRRYNPDYLHLGATRVPFSDVEAVELHLKDRSRLLMNVDDLKQRYIS